ncbi:HD domain-containing protein, partial [Zooshikella harenae]
NEMFELWLEYEKQNTLESKLVKLCDHLLPFLLNLKTNGKIWTEGNVTKSMVYKRNEVIFNYFPEIGNLMKTKIEYAVKEGWLKNV